jgi:GntP family gluconate:H+ symporter
MDPLLVLLIGIAIVLIGILGFRLHAFLTLILAALAVGLLTPQEALYQFAINAGMTESEAYALLSQSTGKRLAMAFGNTAAKIGILIAMASVIGTCLMKSGAADRIVRSALRLFGEKRAPLAFLSSGFTLGIPVFFDTVFYLMIPLGKSMGIRFPKKYGLYIMTIIAGTAIAHSLVPPTPGPLFVAEEMGVDLGVMILGGLAVGTVASLAGYFYALWADRRWDVPLRDTPDATVEELKALSGKGIGELPGLGFSVMPVLLPLILIAGNTVLRVLITDSGITDMPAWAGLLSVSSLLGDPNVALILSAVLSLILLKSRVADSKDYRKFVQDSLYNAGVIILITSAGGALGGMLQQSGIGVRIAGLAEQYEVAVLPLAFFVTALVRTAQGSATVAMITAIGILGGLADPAALGFHPVYLALAIGCGSKPIPWMNDSGFWVVTKMSGMTEMESMRHFSILLTVMGFAGLFATMIIAYIFPMTQL